MGWLMWLSMAVVFGLVIVHRIVAHRYIEAVVAVHGRLPGRDWLWTPDSDPGVERLRLRRIAAVVPLMIALVVFFFGTVTGAFFAR